MRATACIVALVLLAGCSDPPSADGPGGPSTSTPTGGATTGGNGTAALPVTMVLPVLLDGNLGSYAHYCVFPAGQCDTQVVTAGETDVIVEHAGSNFTGLDVNLTWTSTGPATDELALGFMVMSTCEGCSDPFEDEVRGPSPLRATVAGKDLPLNGTSVVHLYVYNPSGFQLLPGGAGYTLTSVDLEFRLEGTVHVAMAP